MSLQDQTTLRVVLYEGQGAAPLPGPDRFAAFSALLEKGYTVTRANGQRPVAPAGRSSLLVLGRFEEGRPPTAEDATGAVSLRFQDVTGLDAAGLVAQVESTRVETQAVRHGDWKPWFPVIDYDRCTNCMQCLSFCLFGVYGVDAAQKI